MAGAFVLFSISIGITEGSYSRLIELYTHARTGHIQIHAKGYLDQPSIYRTIKDYREIEEQLISVPGIVSFTDRIYAPALGFKGSRTTGITINGIDPLREFMTTSIKEKIIKGRYLSREPLNEVMITSELAKILHVDIGEEIALIGQAADGSIANDLFSVTGIIKGKERDILYMHIDKAREFLSLGDQIHEIVIMLDTYKRSGQIADYIRRRLNDNAQIKVSTWYEVEKDFYRAMKMDKQGNWITLTVLMIIVAIGVLNSVLMTLLERTKEFGVMRAIGTSPVQIFFIIIFEMAFLTTMSIVLGIGLSLVANNILSRHGITLPTPIELEGLHFESYVSQVSIETVLYPCLIVFVVSIVVSAFPALRAARITPVRALRAE
jgi:ABC-type lipoprotein release transport system permease subunit